MATTQTHYQPLQRERFFQDNDGEIATTKRLDEKITITIDWSDQLASSETISSAAYVDSGITRSGTSNTTTTTVTTVTGVGEFEITVTTSAGNILQRVYRFYASDKNSSSDYA